MTELKLSGTMREVNLKKTSDMVYPLESPNGWFLSMCGHRHLLEGSHYIPEQLEEGAWFVRFQRTIAPTKFLTGNGHTMEQAWADAVNKVAEFEEYESNGE